MGIKLAKEQLKKTPEEVRIVDMDFSGDDLAAGETILTVTSITILRFDGVAMVPGVDLTKDSHAISGQVLQFVLSKGQNYVLYELSAIVTTSAGQVRKGCGRMKVAPC